MSTTVDTNLEGGILTIDQAAAYLAIPEATLYTWRTRRAGFSPRAVKLGGCLRYRRSDLDAWIAEHVENFDDLAEVVNDRIQKVKHVRETRTVITFNAYDLPKPRTSG